MIKRYICITQAYIYDMKMTHMSTIHAYQRYKNTKVYAYMVTSIHPKIPPSSKIDDWVNKDIHIIYNQSYMPHGDRKT